MRNARDHKLIVATLVGPVFLLETGWFIIDHLLPDLTLNKIPEPLRWSVVNAAILLCAAAGVWWAGKSLLRRWPRPWFPRPFWRFGDWADQRPRLSIIMAPVEAINGLLVIEGAKVSVTLARDLSRTKKISRLAFDRAQLTVTQKRAERMISWAFAPEEAGGFLAEPIEAGHRDFIMIVFRGTGFPMRQNELIDVTRPFDVELSGVIATIGKLKPMIGRLPPVRWSWGGVAEATSVQFSAEQSF